LTKRTKNQPEYPNFDVYLWFLWLNLLLMAAVGVVVLFVYSQLFSHIKISRHIPECRRSRQGVNSGGLLVNNICVLCGENII
jgi:hypothetical protein